MQLSGKIVLVTGATSGLGYSIAKKFLEKDCNVYLLGYHKERVDTAVKSLGKSAKGLVADVVDYPSLERISHEVTPDILINNAGVWLEGQLIEQDEERINKTVDTNLKGVIFSTKAFLPEMIKRNEGFILNISSTSGLKGRKEQAVYVASKYGVRGFTESLEEDLMGSGIKVAGFYPGGMNTQLFEKSGSERDVHDWMDTDKVAEIVVFMVEHNDNMRINHVEVNKK